MSPVRRDNFESFTCQKQQKSSNKFWNCSSNSSCVKLLSLLCFVMSAVTVKRETSQFCLIKNVYYENRIQNLRVRTQYWVFIPPPPIFISFCHQLCEKFCIKKSWTRVRFIFIYFLSSAWSCTLTFALFLSYWDI